MSKWSSCFTDFHHNQVEAILNVKIKLPVVYTPDLAGLFQYNPTCLAQTRIQTQFNWRLCSTLHVPIKISSKFQRCWTACSPGSVKTFRWKRQQQRLSTGNYRPHHFHRAAILSRYWQTITFTFDNKEPIFKNIFAVSSGETITVTLFLPTILFKRVVR